MDSSQVFKFTIRLTSPMSYVEIPFKIPEGGISKLKVMSMFYVTQNTDVETMVIDISSFNRDSYYLVNGSNRGYTLMLPLNKQTSALNMYLNKDQDPNTWDVIKKPTEHLFLPNLNISIFINNELRPLEITNSNAVILEIMIA